MSSLQDPNQPPQAPSPWDVPPAAAPQPPETPPATPGGGPPRDPNQAGWAAPSQPAPTAWGPPPAYPQQPGWTPPPGYPQQPGWTPPPGWAPPPGWPPQGQPPRKGHGCLISFIVVLVLVALGVGGCAVVFGPYVLTEIKLYQDLGTGSVSSISFDDVNGQTTWVIHVRPGHESEATHMACDIIRRDLAGTQFANDDFLVEDQYNQPLAGNYTTCP